MRLKVSNVCQLLDKSKYPATHTQLGCTFTNNGDGSFTINGTIQNSGSWSNPLQQITQNLYGHKILLLTNSTSDIVRGEMKFTLQNGSSKWGTYNSIYTVICDDYKYIAIRIYMDGEDAGKIIDNATVKFQLFDLTEMYGAGNEPTTVEQFRQDFPNEMYEYSPVCWKKFRRLKYIANKEPVQLLDKSKYRGTATLEGITFTNNGDGTWTVVGTAPDDPINHLYVAYSILRFSKEFTQKYFIPGHKIIVGGGKVNYDSFVQWILGWTGGYIASNSSANYPYKITEYPENWGSNYIELRVNKGKTVNFTFKPQFFDLTAIYGAGNEPTTVAQFRADFPNELYDYNLYNYLTLNRGKYIANKEPVQLYAKNIWKEYTDLYGVSIKNNNDGSITLNGTATETFYYTNRLDYEIKPNHKYLYVDYYPQTPSWDTYVGGCEGKVNHESAVQFAIYNLNNDGTIAPSSPTLPRNTLLNTFCMVYKGFTLNNVTIKPQLFDLTEMFGAGHEPKTVAQFRADFPNALYDYNPYNAITFR